MAEWLSGIAIETPYVDLLDDIKAAFQEAVVWAAPVDTPPDGWKRFNVERSRFEVYDAASAAWLALALDASWQGYAEDVGYVSANVIRVNGDRTAVFAAGRRVKIALSGGTVTGTVLSSAYASGQDTTDVTLQMDGAGVDATITGMEIGQDPASLGGKYDKTGGLVGGPMQVAGLLEARGGVLNTATLPAAADSDVQTETTAVKTNGGASDGNQLKALRHVYRTVAGAGWQNTVWAETYAVDANNLAQCYFKAGDGSSAASRAMGWSIGSQYWEMRSGGGLVGNGSIAFGDGLTYGTVLGPVNGEMGFASGARLVSSGTTRRLQFTTDFWRFDFDGALGNVYYIDYQGRALVTMRNDGWLFAMTGLQAPQVSSTGNINANGSIAAQGNVIAYSDARVKTDIETIGDALELVQQLRGCRFFRTDRMTLEIGLIAQEVESVLPEVVTRPVDDNQMYAVDYGKTVALLVEAIKELTARVSQMEKAS